jgi:LPS export ABC transporter protein LptC
MRRVLVSLIAVALFGCQSGPDPLASPTAGTPTASPDSSTAAESPRAGNVDEDTIRLHKTTIKTRQGQKWELQADEVEWMDDRSKANAKTVTWWLVDEDDKKWVKVVSPEADVDMDNEVVTFIGKTVASRLGFDETLEVQHLVYKGKERKFYGSGGVEWHRGTVELKGETLTATSQLDRVQLKGKVRGKSKGGFKGLKEPRKAE